MDPFGLDIIGIPVLDLIKFILFWVHVRFRSNLKRLHLVFKYFFCSFLFFNFFLKLIFFVLFFCSELFLVRFLIRFKLGSDWVLSFISIQIDLQFKLGFGLCPGTDSMSEWSYLDSKFSLLCFFQYFFHNSNFNLMSFFNLLFFKLFQFRNFILF